jgi:hypothetical protein
MHEMTMTARLPVKYPSIVFDAALDVSELRWHTK